MRCIYIPGMERFNTAATRQYIKNIIIHTHLYIVSKIYLTTFIPPQIW
jgi:hypothetical protein